MVSERSFAIEIKSYSDTTYTSIVTNLVFSYLYIRSLSGRVKYDIHQSRKLLKDPHEMKTKRCQTINQFVIKHPVQKY